MQHLEVGWDKFLEATVSSCYCELFVNFVLYLTVIKYRVPWDSEFFDRLDFRCNWTILECGIRLKTPSIIPCLAVPSILESPGK